MVGKALSARIAQVMTDEVMKMISQQHVPQLVKENIQFAGTGGVSEGNAQSRFVPAFQDADTGQVEISCFRDGRQAPCHLVEGLPEDWVTQRDAEGRAVKIKNTVISGFVRLGRFFTRQEAADFMKQQSASA